MSAEQRVNKLIARCSLIREEVFLNEGSNRFNRFYFSTLD